MIPPWLTRGTQLEHIAFAKIGRRHLARVLSVGTTRAEIFDERSGIAIPIAIVDLLRCWRPASPPGLQARAAAWWRDTAPARAGVAWALRHPRRVLELVEAAARGEKVGEVVRRRLEQVGRRVN